MKKETAVAAIIVVAVATFAGGYILGGYGGDTVNGERPAAGDTNARYDSSVLPIGEAPTRGPAGAPVTMVFFADFSNSSTAATAEMIDEVAADERFANAVRVAVKDLENQNARPQVSDRAFHAKEHVGFSALDIDLYYVHAI